MKVASEDLVSKSNKAQGREKYNLLVNSDDWLIARTIYASFTAKGKVKIEKRPDGVSRFSFGLTDLLISKLDFYKGYVDKIPEVKQSNHDDDDFEDEDDDDDKPDDGKTMEGGLIMALANMQVTKRLAAFLPNVEKDFSAKSTHHDFFDCYGIRLDIPRLQYFEGGFMVQGDYHKTEVDETACKSISVEDVLSISSIFGEEIMGKVDFMDGLYDKLNDFNPNMASYLIKPSELVRIAKDEGLE